MRLLNKKIEHCAECPYVRYTTDQNGCKIIVICTHRKRHPVLTWWWDSHEEEKQQAKFKKMKIPDSCELPLI